MSIRFAFHHVDPSAALRDYAENKLSTVVGKFTRKPVRMNVTFSKRDRRQVAQADIVGAFRKEIHAEVRATSLYGAVDRLAAKIGRQLKRYKDRTKDHKVHAASPGDWMPDYSEHHNLAFLGSEVAPLPAR